MTFAIKAVSRQVKTKGHCCSQALANTYVYYVKLFEKCRTYSPPCSNTDTLCKARWKSNSLKAQKRLQNRLCSGVFESSAWMPSDNLYHLKVKKGVSEEEKKSASFQSLDAEKYPECCSCLCSVGWAGKTYFQGFRGFANPFHGRSMGIGIEGEPRSLLWEFRVLVSKTRVPPLSEWTENFKRRTSEILQQDLNNNYETSFITPFVSP